MTNVFHYSYIILSKVLTKHINLIFTAIIFNMLNYTHAEMLRNH